jgi:hypothetical protein
MLRHAGGCWPTWKTRELAICRRWRPVAATRKRWTISTKGQQGAQAVADDLATLAPFTSGEFQWNESSTS